MDYLIKAQTGQSLREEFHRMSNADGNLNREQTSGVTRGGGSMPLSYPGTEEWS